MKDATAAIPLLEKCPEKNSGPERDSNPRSLRYRCNALRTELSKPHESGRVWVRPFTFSGRKILLKYMSSMVTDVQQWQLTKFPEFFSGHFSSSVMAAFTSFILSLIIGFS